MAKLKLEQTTSERGFIFWTFTDLYGSECSLSESSLATDEAIHFGVDKAFNGKESYRMHLSRKQVKQLLPILKYFAKTGELPGERKRQGA